MIIIPFNNCRGGGNTGNPVALLIVINFILLITFGIMYYLFIKDSYVGTFWGWSWDTDYFLIDNKTNSGLASGFFWIPLFLVNGVALIVYLWEVVENILNKNEKQPQQTYNQ